MRGPENPADGMTKTGRCPALDRILRFGKAEFNVEQWVLRSKDNAQGLEKSGNNSEILFESSKNIYLLQNIQE